MKAINRIFIILFSLILFLTTVMSSALVIAKTPAIYKAVLIEADTVRVDEKGNMSASLSYFGGRAGDTAALNNKQIERVINHISDYLFDFGSASDFSLTLKNVEINGQTVAEAEAFGQEAVRHMADVKRIFKAVLITDLALLCLLCLLTVFFVKNKQEAKALLFKYSGYTYLGILSAFILFFGYCGAEYFIKHASTGHITFYDVIWNKLHYVFFLFNAEDISGSFFNDTLTQLLNINFFMAVVLIIVAVALLVIVAQLTVFAVIGFKNKIKR